MLGLEEDYSVDEELIRYAKRNIENENFKDLNAVKKILEDFQFSCTVLLDFDIWEQGKVFADVNFNQNDNSIKNDNQVVPYNSIFCENFVPLFDQINKENLEIRKSVLSNYIDFSEDFDPFLMKQY